MTPLARRIAISVIAVCAAMTVVACNDDGRELQAAPPPTAPPTTGAAITNASVDEPFALTSPALADGAALDVRFTCDGGGAFPPLTIAGVTPNMVELAVMVVDMTTDYVHFVVAGLPPTTTTLNLTAGLPEGAVRGTSSGGVLGWEPPCPPPGDQAHEYRFAVYAFAEPVGMQPGLAGADALAVLPPTAIGFAELTGTYARP